MVFNYTSNLFLSPFFIFFLLIFFIYEPFPRLDTDIAFANECKLKSLLVLTGVSSIMEARRSRKNLQPDFFLGSLADLLKLLDA